MPKKKLPGPIAKVALPPKLIDSMRATRNISPGMDAGIEKLVLENFKTGDFNVAGAITSADLERTIDGASTLSISLHDPDRKLLRSGIFETAVDIQLDGLYFRLVSVGKNDNELRLTFEERAVALLRRKDKPLKVSRDKITRSQFVKRLVEEVKTYPIDFYAPDLTRAGRVKKTQTERTQTKSSGIAKNANVTVKGARASGSQIRVMNEVLDAATSEGATGKALTALVAMIIVECEFKNIQGKGADSISFGVIQAIPGRSSGIDGTFTKAQALNIAYSVRSILKHSTTSFENSKGGGLIGVARRHPSWSIGKIAALVNNGVVNGGEGSPDYVSKVNGRKAEAEKIISAYGTSGGAAADGKYEFSRGQGKEREDSWTCIQRLAEEVNFRAFCSANTIYFLSDEDLIKSQPQLVIAEFDPGVMSLEFEFDSGKRVQEATVVLRTSRWRVNPGAVVEIQEAGPADGRWIVQSFRRSLTDLEATVELRRASKRLPEPKGESESDGASSSADTNNEIVNKAIARVNAIDAKKQPYLWGGGHGGFNDPRGYDCSGFVSSVLHAAGILKGSPLTTVGLNSWGKRGEGRIMTVWVKETGNARASHTFITFKVGGKTRFAEAGGANKSRTGWHSPRSTAGFTPRHWPGT
jgi:hypothetical protein